VSGRRPGEPEEIGTLYAALSHSAGRGEGIAGVMTADGWMPLVFSTRKALDLMLGQCQAIADASGDPVRVVRFERSGLVGEFRPGGKT
jgi:hypothetical protein